MRQPKEKKNNNYSLPLGNAFSLEPHMTTRVNLHITAAHWVLIPTPLLNLELEVTLHLQEQHVVLVVWLFLGILSLLQYHGLPAI